MSTSIHISQWRDVARQQEAASPPPLFSLSKQDKSERNQAKTYIALVLRICCVEYCNYYYGFDAICIRIQTAYIYKPAILSYEVGKVETLWMSLRIYSVAMDTSLTDINMNPSHTRGHERTAHCAVLVSTFDFHSGKKNILQLFGRKIPISP